MLPRLRPTFYTAPLLAIVTLATTMVLAPTHVHAFKDGFYIGFGFGGGVQLDGERGVALKTGSCPEGNGYFLWYEPPSSTCRYAASKGQYEEINRTAFGEGFGIHFRLGYNILGHASLEASVSGHGDAADFKAGFGTANFQVRWHILKLLEVAEVLDASRKYDVDIMVGGGYAIGGYTPSETAPGISGTDDEKGWEGFNISFGLAFKYQVQPWLSLGADVTFLFPFFGEFIANWDEGYRSEPLDGATGATSVIPSFTITFHP